MVTGLRSTTTNSEARPSPKALKDPYLRLRARTAPCLELTFKVGKQIRRA
jgi:hypothetical protein